MLDTVENRLEISQELLTVSYLHHDAGNQDYAAALRRQSMACLEGTGDIEDYARILGKAEEAL
ncbi:hypothetical protein FGG32_gp011 [Mycobacterium phage EricB]|uniref:DUF7273 domain-containing protein n=1 Tax=Mycobacterium phage EricB TaxID=2922220 RepID=G1EBX0_9CAUD|nr:hypothetical protein FGG32_gp011 [Mycobacterium phage EricB]AEJ93336.1 hypothetical protein ERICB_98 [Mycobacterium phage EricB]